MGSGPAWGRWRRRSAQREWEPRGCLQEGPGGLRAALEGGVHRESLPRSTADASPRSRQLSPLSCSCGLTGAAFKGCKYIVYCMQDTDTQMLPSRPSSRVHAGKRPFFKNSLRQGLTV